MGRSPSVGGQDEVQGSEVINFSKKIRVFFLSLSPPSCLFSFMYYCFVRMVWYYLCLYLVEFGQIFQFLNIMIWLSSNVFGLKSQGGEGEETGWDCGVC